MEQSLFSEIDPIEQLAEKWSLNIIEILNAREQARLQRHKFKEACEKEKLVSVDTSVVVFGSLGRDEYTSGSDADWTLLIDGGANSDHRQVAQRIESLVEELFKPPNPRGAFNRYLEQQATYLNRQKDSYRVPRFLLNDVVRFWRTMAVDFAGKQWERGGVGWGIRNAKLRLSRKLIYVSGLLTCFSCALDVDLRAKVNSGGDKGLEMVNHLRTAVKKTPLAVLAESLLLYDTRGEVSPLLFNAYNEFLGILNDPDKRKRLEDLRAEESLDDSLFAEIRRISDAFQSGLDKFFFENQNINPLTRKYGVF